MNKPSSLRVVMDDPGVDFASPLFCKQCLGGSYNGSQLCNGRWRKILDEKTAQSEPRDGEQNPEVNGSAMMLLATSHLVVMCACFFRGLNNLSS